MLQHINQNEVSCAKELFSGIEDSMVIACLQGYQGDAYVDHKTNPTVGLIVSGEYSFFAGDPLSPIATTLVKELFRYIRGDKTVSIFDENAPDWEQTLLSFLENHPVVTPRYGIVQKDYDFDIVKLKQLEASIPEGYLLKSFDQDIYKQAMADSWSQEFCETFTSASEYLDKGFGCAAVKDGLLVSGASTMTVYDGGTETQVATRPGYEGKGLALACAAGFIMECMKRGIRPCWDAANEASLHMAIKLGYEYKGEYTTIAMTRP